MAGAEDAGADEGGADEAGAGAAGSASVMTMDLPQADAPSTPTAQATERTTRFARARTRDLFRLKVTLYTRSRTDARFIGVRHPPADPVFA
ncbi:hypothetical protein GCM10012278_24560 [Nonomuraea glycinis]|uniref:Uncharacterized protein n=1 Tax=Nonomuraea glycinis TaxID=2047744 RepID=A0A918A2M8_9ACTN|nr:hypothetical protein GCM10012278_24560 [Nonomuraea glycinis]